MSSASQDPASEGHWKDCLLLEARRTSPGKQLPTHSLVDLSELDPEILPPTDGGKDLRTNQDTFFCACFFAFFDRHSPLRSALARGLQEPAVH